MNDDELLKDFLLEAFPNPERKGCPDEKTLRASAEERLPPGNPTLQHVASCSECYSEYLHYREDWKDNLARVADTAPVVDALPKKDPSPNIVLAPVGSSKKLSWAIAAGFLIALGSGFFLLHEHRISASSSALVASSQEPSSTTVDLFNAVTTRGVGNDDEPTPLKQVSLPSSILNLSVTLPRFSEAGPYKIIVAKDRAGNEIVARGLGNAVKLNDKVSVTVRLDLTHAAPGMYFLATVRGSDNGTYYYPLLVK